MFGFVSSAYDFLKGYVNNFSKLDEESFIHIPGNKPEKSNQSDDLGIDVDKIDEDFVQVYYDVKTHLQKYAHIYSPLSKGLMGVGAVIALAGTIYTAPKIFIYLDETSLLVNSKIGIVSKKIGRFASYLFDKATAICALGESGYSYFSFFMDGGFLRKVVVLTAIVPAVLGVVVISTLALAHLIMCASMILMPMVPGAALFTAGMLISKELNRSVQLDEDSIQV